MIEASRINLITPALVDVEAFLPTLAAALDAAPIACLRIRMGEPSEDALRRAADLIRPVAHDRDVAVTLTDHFLIAPAHGLDGVHLSDARLSIRDARKSVGDDGIVGVFAGTSRHDGMNAAEAGADYVAFGPVAETALGDGKVAGPELFTWWAEMIETPVVAEGGVTEAQIAGLAPHADFVSLDEAIWTAAEGPAEAIRRIAALLAD